MNNPSYEQYNYILGNYEEHKNHEWFRKIKRILNRGEPERIYT